MKALHEKHAEKLKKREGLAEEVKTYFCDFAQQSCSSCKPCILSDWFCCPTTQIAITQKRIQAMMKNSTDLVRKAMRRDRALQKADASYKLSVARGFETKTCTRDLIRGSPTKTK